MRKPFTLLCLLGLAFVIAGCQRQAPAEPEADQQPGAAAADQPAPAETVLVLPEELRHEAALWHGLDQIRPKTYWFSMENGGREGMGSQVAEINLIEGGVAQLSITRTGALADIGNEEVEVRPDGIWLVSTTLGTLDKPAKSMPANPAVGETWSNEYVLTATGGQKLQGRSNFRVARQEEVTTRAGTFQALLVVEEGTITVNDQRSTTRARSWYAKGHGMVKLIAEVTTPDQPKTTFTVELTQENAPE